jgi:predicted permease
MSWTRLRNIFRPSARAEADAEIAFHIEERTRELIEQGLDPVRARQLAEERFGPVDLIERELIHSTERRYRRDDRAEALMHLKRDLGFAIRSLRKSPGFTAAAIATLTLGLGATLVVVTIVDGVLLRPLPYRDPAGISMVWMTFESPDTPGNLPFSSGFYNLIEREQRSFESFAAFRSWSYSLATPGSDDTEPVTGARVSPALFTVLGVRPFAGQAFTREHAVSGAPKVAVISYDLWQRRFGGDASVIGRQVLMSGEPFTITGIMPTGFAFPRGAELPAPLSFGLRTDVWTPLVFDSADAVNFGTQNLSVVGRLRRPQLEAEAEVQTIVQRFLDENAPQVKLGVRLVSLADQASQTVKRGLLILLGSVLFVLAIASVNVANLILARMHARERELAVRAAMGAGWRRIAGQLVTENMLLCAAGGLAGLVLAYWGVQVMLAMIPGALPRADDVGLDWRIALVTTVIVILAGSVYGFVAASGQSSRLAHTLHTGGMRSAGGVKERFTRRFMVAAEVALSLVLLIGAALLTRSFIELQRVRPGVNPENVLTAEVSLPIPGRFDPSQGPVWAAALDGVTAMLNASSGVVAAGAVSSLPLSGVLESGGVRVVGEPLPDNGIPPSAQYSIVSGRYFAAAGIPVLAGRAFDARDDALDARTIVVNRTFAVKRFGSEAAALGREVRPTFEFTRDPPPRVIVGVVGDVKQASLDEVPGSQVYVPQSQMSYPQLTLVVRTIEAPLGAARIVRDAVRAAAPTATVKEIRTMDDVVAQSLERQRFSMTLVGIFAVLALVLAIVGLYGVLALLVGRRQREIGVRLALGGTRGAVVRFVVGEGARVAAIGVLLGLVGAYALTRTLRSLLYGVEATDTATYALAALFVFVIALASTWGPARRAARVDPRVAMSADALR